MQPHHGRIFLNRLGKNCLLIYVFASFNFIYLIPFVAYVSYAISLKFFYLINTSLLLTYLF